VPEARYRIDSLTVEGFKAFSAEQEITLGGKHCFLFGVNARGKSSIVEAIRWCLFGSERDSDVRNRFSEAVDCRVELRLRDATGLWRLERRLRPGQLRSDLTIRNPDGGEVTQKEALPNLVRLGTSAGAVVFFSAQQANRSRGYGDLTRFHEVLYAHLNLSEAERFRTELGSELEEQFEIQRRRADDLQSAEDNLREQLNNVGARLEEILRSPPWESDDAPTRVMSDAKIRSLIGELASASGNSADVSWECAVALDQAQTWVNQLSVKLASERGHALAAVKAEAQSLSQTIERIRTVKARHSANSASALDLERHLAEVCDGNELGEIEARLEAASARLNIDAQFALARKAVAPLLNHEMQNCPICGLTCDGVALLSRVMNDLQQANSAQVQAAEEVQKLARQKEQSLAIIKQKDAAIHEAENAHQQYGQLLDQLTELRGWSPATWEQSAEAQLVEFNARIEDLQQEGRGATEHTSKRTQRIKALREEWRYHQLRDEEQRLRRDLQEGLQPARDRLRALEDFRSTVANIHDVLREEFDAAVDRALPTVSSQLTDAFRRLTDHPAFDLLRVQRATGPDQLVVRVGSTHASVPWSRPEDVLNGGAYAALGLIPHFVFSGFHAEQAELNALIVDDPSQSFDTTHVELLLEELRRASEHAQLFLATHEQEKFRAIVERLYSIDSFQIIRVTGFHPNRGPTIEYG
jgi:DNA repair exonuclease SbcCD ATPase subunit